MAHLNPRTTQIRHGSPPEEALWFDPVRWSWLVRAWALFLVIASLAEYFEVLQAVLGPWLPSGRVQNPNLWLTVALLLPFVASQVGTGLWLLLLARPQDPSPDEGAAVLGIIAQTGLVRKQLWRRPRLLSRRVAQPHLVSIFGAPFLIMPNRALPYWRHHLGIMDGERAWRAVVRHELGHLEAWDDLLFLPWLFYWISSLALCAIGLYRVVEGRLDWSVALSHLSVVLGLGLLGRYVVRRREAYCDAFAAVVGGAIGDIRSALEVLTGATRHRTALFRFHFDPHSRLEWLRGRGRRFLDMTRVDLGLVALVYLAIGTTPLAKAAFHDSLRLVARALDTATTIAADSLTLLIIAGVSLARGGKRLSWTELAGAAGICVLGKLIHEWLRRGIPSLGGLWLTAFEVAFQVSFYLLPFAVLFVLVSSWSVAFLAEHRVDSTQSLGWIAFVLAIAWRFTDAAPNLLSQAPLSNMISLLQEGHLEQAGSLSWRVLGSYLLVGVAKASLVVTLWIWAALLRQRLRERVCRWCGTSIGGARQSRIELACSRCGLPVFYHQSAFSRPHHSRERRAHRLLLAGIALVAITAAESSNMRAHFASLLLGETIGPAWVPSLGLAPATTPLPLTADAAPAGIESCTFRWRDRAIQDERGDVNVTVHWDSRPRPEWHHQRTLCSFIAREHGPEEGLVSIPDFLTVTRGAENACQFFHQAKRTHMIFWTKVEVPRCEREGLIIARTPYIDSSGEEDWTVIRRRSIAMGAVPLMISSGEIVPDRECASMIRAYTIVAVALLIGLLVLAAIFLRRMFIKSRYGQRSTAAEVSSTQCENPPALAWGLAKNGPRSVMLVERDEKIRCEVIAILAANGFEPVAFYDFDDLLGDTPPIPQATGTVVISTDKTASIEFIAAIRARYPAVKIIGLIPDSLMVTNEQKHEVCVLSKNEFTMAKLIAAIQQARHTECEIHE